MSKLRAWLVCVFCIATNLAALDLDRAPKTLSLSEAERQTRKEALQVNDPLLSPERKARTEDLAKKIGVISRALVEAVYHKKNKAESERLLRQFRKHVELMLVGVENEGWRSRLSLESESLNMVCDLARFIADLRASSGLEAVSAPYREGLEKLQPRCSRT